MNTNTRSFSLLSKDDLYLFNEGSHIRLYDKLGAHPVSAGGRDGAYFALWAPNAEQVYVTGDFNGWEKQGFRLSTREGSGIWEGFIPGLGSGALYKYHIESRVRHYRTDKADPFAFHCEQPPRTASVVWDLSYAWKDAEWMAKRKNVNALDAPISIYELHPGSWKRVPGENNRPLGYR